MPSGRLATVGTDVHVIIGLIVANFGARIANISHSSRRVTKERRLTMKKPTKTDKGIKAFKVVGPQGYGTNVTGAIFGVRGITPTIREFLDKYPNYFPKYKRGAIINQAPKSAGVFCFSTIVDARKFIHNNFQLREQDVKILQVTGWGRRKITEIIPGCMELSTLFRKCDPFDLTRAPPRNHRLQTH